MVNDESYVNIQWREWLIKSLQSLVETKISGSLK